MKRKDFELGLIARLAMLPGPWEKKQPIACLLNGIRVPPLPREVMKEYPFVVLYKNFSFYHISLFKNAEHYQNDYGWVVGDPTTATEDLCENYIFSSEAFVWKKGSTKSRSAFASGVYWSNVDILNEDGTVRLKKSIPVPEYA